VTKVLLVEDDKMLRDAFTLLLQFESYAVDAAADGQEALDYCRDNHYDIILLDLMMPVLDGAGFLRAANLAESAPDTRVVILSNLSSGDTLNTALALGAHRHEVKSNLSPADTVRVIEEELSARL